jgi:hypothetical protein
MEDKVYMLSILDAVSVSSLYFVNVRFQSGSRFHGQKHRHNSLGGVINGTAIFLRIAASAANGVRYAFIQLIQS